MKLAKNIDLGTSKSLYLHSFNGLGIYDLSTSFADWTVGVKFSGNIGVDEQPS